MSGGAYDYASSRISYLADEIEGRLDAVEDERVRRLRLVFVERLRDVAEAARMIEWIDSGDCGPGDEVESILKALRLQDVFVIVQEEGAYSDLTFDLSETWYPTRVAAEAALREKARLLAFRFAREKAGRLASVEYLRACPLRTRPPRR